MLICYAFVFSSLCTPVFNSEPQLSGSSKQYGLPHCEVQLQNLVFPDVGILIRAVCICGAGFETASTSLQGREPLTIQCLSSCFPFTNGHFCHAPTFSSSLSPGLSQCCERCGGSPDEIIINTKSRRVACRPSAPIVLSAVNISLSPEQNGGILETNFRSIVTDTTNPDFASTLPTVSGIPFLTDISFYSDNPGKLSSLEDSLLDVSVTRKSYIQPLQADLNAAVHPFVPERTLSNNVHFANGEKYDCYGKRCGAQVTIYSDKSIRQVVIANAVQKLKSQTHKFDDIFVNNDRLIQIINRHGTRYAVFVPFKEVYLKQFLNK